MFQFDEFYAEVRRTAKENALLAIVGYGRMPITPELDRIMNWLYFNIASSFGDAERHYVDEAYQPLPFTFAEIPSTSFRICYDWTLEHLPGYLQTWSAIKH